MIKAMYRLSELAPLLGYKSSNGLKKHFDRILVKMTLIGNTYYIYLCDIQDQVPELAASLIQADQINNFNNLSNQELSIADLHQIIE